MFYFSLIFKWEIIITASFDEIRANLHHWWLTSSHGSKCHYFAEPIYIHRVITVNVTLQTDDKPAPYTVSNVIFDVVLNQWLKSRSLKIDDIKSS